MWLDNTSVCLNSPGHLPVKLPDYNNRLRVLVATYVTFSPDGTELLVNMGGEQVMPRRTNKESGEESFISPEIFLVCVVSFVLFDYCFNFF